MNEAEAFRLEPSSTVRTRLFSAISFLCVVFIVGASSAPQAKADRGSALDQYVEQVPGAGGDKDPNDAPPKDPAKVLGTQNYQEFEELGEDGIAAAALAASGGPPDSSANQSTSGGPAEQRAGAAASAPGTYASDAEGSGIGEVLKAATGTSGASALIFIVALGVIASMVAFATGRTRRTS